jgi:hypothetical protein
MRRASVAIALVALAALLPPVAAHAAVPNKPIQPGAILFMGGGQCTQNFVYRDSQGALYSSTAGHCVGYVGQRMVDETRQEFGTVIWEVDGTHDFALIRIDPARYADVSPQMRIWGGPTGYTTSDMTTIGDPVLQHGYGMIYGSNDVSRPRRGALQWDTRTGFGFAGAALFGDSGGPALHMPTGRAIGFVNSLGSVVSMVSGSTIEYFLERLAEDGYDDLEIVTAPLAPLI